MRQNDRGPLGRFETAAREMFGLGPGPALAGITFIVLLILFAVYWFFHSAPPSTVTMTSGPPVSIFNANAYKYRNILARNGVKLRVLTSEGSLENLKRLTDPSSKVDIGFVQDGETGQSDERVESLGSISYAPILVFYRSAERIDLLSQFEGRRLAIGPEGSGTRALALTLLAANGIKPGGSTQLVDLEGDKAVYALIYGDVDAVFLMGESASVQNLRKLMYAPGVRIFDFTQAEGYSHKIVYLNKLVLPMGTVDFGKNIPQHDVYLVAPMVELVVRKGLHPALVDLFMEAAREIHGRAGIFQYAGEFPAPQQHDFHISSEALRYYKSGRSFLYRNLPFRFASLVNRILVVFVPLIVVLVPGLKFIPMLFRMRIKLRFYRWYRTLMVLERELMGPLTAGEKEKMLERLDHLERAVKKMKVPASFADQFYGLRGDIAFVRERLMAETVPPVE